ncbi:hypothetical protein VPH35_136435 [Triticum aestivum]|uniref:Uncharacterized protein n=1 Tax=Aegilops tauschii TaxID=37682 RepID=M8CRQ3_AEGTA
MHINHKCTKDKYLLHCERGRKRDQCCDSEDIFIHSSSPSYETGPCASTCEVQNKQIPSGDDVEPAKITGSGFATAAADSHTSYCQTGKNTFGQLVGITAD